ncbi:MAG TPA: hypothetical protein VFJ71_04590, partial [Candidatus Limnocylindrales bacterium]|nr:hypothetical protein [Candidatus Limnocylindrales bacterium]
MGSVDHGAQRASSSTLRLGSRPTQRVPRPRGTSRRGTRWLAAVGLGIALLSGGVAPAAVQIAAASGDILMPRSELLSLPTSGSAWSALKTIADEPLGTPSLCDQDSKHHLRTFAAALVYARTGVASYGTKARDGVMAALPTQVVGCDNATLALGRQLAAYVFAADLADLSGTDDATFRSWLSAIRTKNIGGHSVWTSITVTHKLAPGNWGAHAGSARIAADLYLGDTTDLAAAARVTRGFLGDRSAYAGFTDNLDAADLSWTCTGSAATYTPEDGACTRSGINLDGAVATDISRGGSLHWPPLDPGIPYQLESIQGMGLQVELLYRHGYPGAWSWSNSALKRAAAIVTRSGAAGGTGWNDTTASRQMPWLLNKRYGTSIPTVAAGMGRSIGFTDWLYGSGSASSGAAPVVTTPTLSLRAHAVPMSGIPVFLRWSLASSSDGLRRYDLQVSRDGGSYVGLTLATATSSSRWVTVAAGHHYTFRVRAVDRSGRIGAWKTVGPRHGSVVSDASSAIGYRGTWAKAWSTAYLGGAVHYTRASGATARLAFSGTSVAWIGPAG